MVEQGPAPQPGAGGLPAAPVAPATAPAPPRRSVSFDKVVSWAVGVVIRPTATMREISANAPVGWGLLLVAVTGFLSVATQPPWEDMLSPLGDPGVDGLPYEGFSDVMQNLRTVLLVLSPVLFVLLELFFAAVYFLTGRALGGRASFSGLLACFCFANVPNLFSVPAGFFVTATGGAGAASVYSAVSNVLSVWVLVLAFFAIREHFRFTTGRALAALFLPLLVLLALLIMVVIIVAVVIIAAMAG